MYTELVMIILGISLILYMILGGADFGAGILELFVGDRSNSTVSKAMAPVWEANHMWLIIAVVILFNGFPKAYIILSTNLHIPVLLFLVAIILRGTAFTFRHYDAFKDKSEKVYSGLFRYASLTAVFFLGVTISAFFSGTLPPTSEGTFTEIFIDPWFNWFACSVGLFLVTISSYIAGVFLLGEVPTEEGYDRIYTFIKWVFGLSIASGVGVFFSSYFSGYKFHETFLTHPVSIGIGVVASLLVPYIFRLIVQKKVWKLRMTVGVQIVLIMFGWFIIQWPNLAVFSDGSFLNMHDAASPVSSMKVLFIALAVGVVIIFPSLFYLFKIFKSDSNW